MPFAGYLVFEGTLKLFWVATAGAIGCNLGSLIAYEIGCYGGRPLVEKYGRWAYDNPKFIILNLALGGGYPQGVNKVQSPYPGLPQSTIDKIKTGKGDFLVDWLLVTKD